MRRVQNRTKIRYSVGAWKQTRHDRRVRGIGKRTRGESLGETDSVLRYLVQRGSLDIFISITMHVIGPQSINGD